MAVLKRHWKATAFNLVVVLCGLGLLWFRAYFHHGNASAQAIGTVASESATGQPITGTDPVLYARVSRLQLDLCLTSDDLGRMQCTKEMSKATISSLVNWCKAHADELAAAEQSRSEAQSKLAYAYRKINIGPKDQSLIRSLDQLQSDLGATAQTYKTLKESAASAVSSAFGTQQAQLWQTARINTEHGVPLLWRYTSGISADQAKQLARAAKRQRRQQLSDNDIARTLSASDLPEPQLTTGATCDEALAAEREVLPPPKFIFATQ